MSGTNSIKEEADALLNTLYDSLEANSKTVIVSGHPARDAGGAITPHMRDIREVLLADGLIWETARLSIGITDKGIAMVESTRKGEVLKMEIDSPYPTTAEGIATELGYWVRRQQDGDPGSNHWVQVQARIGHLRYLDGKTLEEKDMKSQKSKADAPPLSPARAITILEDHIAAAEKLRAEKFGFAGREGWSITAGSILHQAFRTDNPIFKAFSTSKNIVFNMHDSDEKLRQIANGVMDAQIAVLRSAIEQLTWNLPESNEAFHPKGSQHDAYIEIRALIQTAKKELMVVDEYVDGTLWTLLKNLKPSVTVRVMTENPKPDFAHEAKLFVTQHGNTVEARKTKDYHDRFIVIDGANPLHLGASIKDAGNKAFAWTEFSGSSTRKAVIADIEDTWKAASPITF